MRKLYTLKQEQLHMKKKMGPKTSGHEVDFGTFTHEGNNYVAWITKLNKHEGVKGQESSMLEVAFSEVALLFIKPGLTPPARIVINSQEGTPQVIGVASENFNMQIKKQIDKGVDCYSFNSASWHYEAIPKAIQGEISQQDKENTLRSLLGSRRLGEEEVIGEEALKGRIHLDQTQKAVNFLDKMPRNFFVNLMKKYHAGEVVVDMESMASILTASYVLEEDDLHKGNIGFYVTDAKDTEGSVIMSQDNQPKKQFNFFKIDHDLMFSDSIMSQKDMRIANIFYDKHSFKISTRDLDGFPDLKDSGNHYWPTKKRLFAAGDKAYSDKEEREAFANLKNNEAFVHAKWKYFLKSAIMPVELVERSLVGHLDKDKNIDKINMVRNSIDYRIGKLKEKMLESQQFRNYIVEHGTKAFVEVEQEISDYIQNMQINETEQHALKTELSDNFRLMAYCARERNLPKEQQIISTLLQSILLDNYNFLSATKTTKQDVHVALDKVQYWNKHNVVDARCFSSACVALHVIQKSDCNEQFEKEQEILKQTKEDYLKPKEIKSLKHFEEAADKIRASNLPLKQQKNEILSVLKEANLPLKDLHILKKDLQKKEPDSVSLKFINQLRSDLWLVKKIFGTYGKTTTSSMMINEIDAQIVKRCAIKTKQFRRQYSDERELDALQPDKNSPSIHGM